MATAPRGAKGASSAPPAAPDSPQQLAMLKQQAAGLATMLNELQRRIEELQGGRATPEPGADQAAG